MQQPEEEGDDWVDDDLIELDLIDPLYDAGKIDPNITGRRDRRTLKRRGRVVPLLIRAHPRVAAMLDLILQRDGHEHLTDLLVIMLQVYCKTYGRVRKSELPPDEVLIRDYLHQRSNRDERERKVARPRYGIEARKQPGEPHDHS